MSLKIEEHRELAILIKQARHYALYNRLAIKWLEKGRSKLDDLVCAKNPQVEDHIVLNVYYGHEDDFEKLTHSEDNLTCPT